MSLLHLILILSALSFVYAVTTPLDSQTLLGNAQLAQALNVQFERVDSFDSCTSGELACVMGSFAQCLKGSWRLETCPQERQCFALPSVRNNGSFIACTSESNALSLIKACGAQGGLFSTQFTHSSVPFPTVNDTRSTSTPSPGSTSMTGGGSSSTPLPNCLNTLTPILGQGQTVSLPPTTKTLRLDEAYSIISSLLANGGSIVSSPSGTPSSLVSASLAASATRSSVLTLRPAPSRKP